jgi:hypothetical protein
MLKDMRRRAYLGLVTTSLTGAAVAVAMAAMAADEQFNVTTIVPLPHSDRYKLG